MRTWLVLLFILCAQAVKAHVIRRHGDDDEAASSSLSLPAAAPEALEEAALLEEGAGCPLPDPIGLSRDGTDETGTTRLELQAAMFRLLAGAAMRVWRRQAYPPDLPHYSWGAFTGYVYTAVNLWLRLDVDVGDTMCRASTARLKSVVETAALTLHNACAGDLPKTSDDAGIPGLYVGTREEQRPQASGHTSAIFWNNDRIGSGQYEPNRGADLAKELRQCSCTELPDDLRDQWCAPLYSPSSASPRAGWRWWMEAFYPALVDAFSCGFDADAVEADPVWAKLKAHADGSTEWDRTNPHSLPNRHWDIFDMLARRQDPAFVADHAGSYEVVLKTWRLTRSYIANLNTFNLEKPQLYNQKELSRFVPFVGQHVYGSWDVRGPNAERVPSSERPLNKRAWGVSGGATYGIHPLWFQYLNGQATERQQFYGPNTWTLFHTVAEVIAARDQQADLPFLFRFLLSFRLMHPCPHCREHLNKKVSVNDRDSYDALEPLHSHSWRRAKISAATGTIASIWITSSEFLTYPLEWMALGLTGSVSSIPEFQNRAIVSQFSHMMQVHMPDAPDTAVQVRGRDLSNKLFSIRTPRDAPLYVWKMHNAVDSSIESKHEERTGNFPPSYYPISEKYRATEPWGGEAGDWPANAAYKDTELVAPEGHQRPGTWAQFRVRMTTRCGLDKSTWQAAQSKTLFPLEAMDESQWARLYQKWAGVAPAPITDEQQAHVQLLSKSTDWRTLWFLRTIAVSRSELLTDSARRNRDKNIEAMEVSFQAFLDGYMSRPGSMMDLLAGASDAFRTNKTHEPPWVVGMGRRNVASAARNWFMQSQDAMTTAAANLDDVASADHQKVVLDHLRVRYLRKHSPLDEQLLECAKVDQKVLLQHSDKHKAMLRHADTLDQEAHDAFVETFVGTVDASAGEAVRQAVVQAICDEQLWLRLADELLAKISCIEAFVTESKILSLRYRYVSPR